MTIAAQSSGYSSRVSLNLEINGSVIDVAQVGPDYLIVRGDVMIAPESSGVLSIDVDGRIERHDVYFPHGYLGKERVKFF